LLSALHTHTPFTESYPPPPASFPLSLHDALPISQVFWVSSSTNDTNPTSGCSRRSRAGSGRVTEDEPVPAPPFPSKAKKFVLKTDRKSTRLNSSHRTISYAVFCLKKKK